jgi:hypothetical protein
MSEYQATRMTSVPKVVYQVGFWSAVVTTVWILAFNVAALVLKSPLLAVGSALLLAPSFVILMVSIHHYAPEGKKLWSQIGLSFAIIYTATVGLNYFLYLTVVRQNPQGYAWLTMDLRADSAFWALEVLGYTFMSLGALLVVPIFSGGRVGSAIRWLFVLNGGVNIVATLAVLLTANPLHILVLVSLGVWSIAFPIATILLAVVFKRADRMKLTT